MMERLVVLGGCPWWEYRTGEKRPSSVKNDAKNLILKLLKLVVILTRGSLRDKIDNMVLQRALS
jgi:hypothetical protein